MPKFKLNKDGKLLDDKGVIVADAEIENLKEIVSEIAVVDKEQIFNEHLKDRFNIEPDSLKNINDIATKARKEEKDKLYKELETHKTSAKTYEEKAKQLEAAQTELNKRIADLEGSGKKDKNSASEELKAIKEQYERDKAVNDKAIEEFKRDMLLSVEKEKLNAYKAQVIAAAGGKIIPELVMGDSQESINLSAENAKRRYNELVASVADANKNKETENRNLSSTALNSSIKINQGSIPTELTASQIAQMSPKEYAEHRQKLLKATASHHLGIGA